MWLSRTRAGGSVDSYTLGIAHLEGAGETAIAVLDLTREVMPPFSPAAVTESFVQELKRFGLSEVHGDSYARDWVSEQFAMRGVEYIAFERTKSQIYAEFLPLINSKRVELLDVPRLHNQLLTLERRTTRGTARENIDHMQNAHDDLVNSACGCLVLAAVWEDDIVREAVKAWGSEQDLKNFDAQRARNRLKLKGED
jgi:hypothetical protein